MSKFSDFWKTVIEKPGDATHSEKWDRCVEHVKASGSGANAYAVCTAMLGDESFKATESDEEFKSRVDGYIKRLNISSGVPSKVVDATTASKTVGTAFTGPVPESLLARQDLEGSTKSMKIKKDGSDHDLTIEIHNGSEETTKAVFEGCELSDIKETEKWNGVSIYMTPPMSDSDGHPIGCYVVVGQDGSLQVFFALDDAREFVDSVFGKGVLEETKKDLIEMADEAKEDGEKAQTDLVGAITRVQQKRQKATIVAREAEGEAKGKSFKQNWKKENE